MAALPYMQLYIADYLADTMHLSTEEHGAYLLLMFNYWQTGKPIPKSRLAKIARMSNERWSSVENSLNEFFTDNGEEWIHERIDRDLASVMAMQGQRSAAGKKSAEARKNKNTTKLKQDGERKNSERSTGVKFPFNENPTNKDTDKDINTEDPPKSPKGSCGEGFDFNSVEIPEWLSPETWRQWGEFCIELGKPLKTQRGATACIKRLDEFRQQGHTPESVILHTIANDWKTLSPPHSVNQENNFIDYDGSFARLIISSRMPKNKAEEIAKSKYSNARLRSSHDTTCRIAWRGYLYEAYKQTGEQPYTEG